MDSGPALLNAYTSPSDTTKDVYNQKWNGCGILLASQVIALLILLFSMVLFITEWIPSAVTSVIACLLFSLTGICSFSKAFSGFSNSTVILVFGMLVIGNAMFESGVAQKIGNAVMRISGGSERKFILFAGGSSIFMSMFLANMAVIAMYLAVMSSVCKTNPNVKLKNICLATTMGAMFGGVCTLVESTPQLTMQTILEGATGQTAGMWDFMPVGLCLSAMYLLYVLFIGYPLGKKIWDKDDGSENLNQLDMFVASRTIGVETDKRIKRKQIYMYIILILLVVLFVTEIVSNVIATCICAILCVVTRCTTEKSVLKNMDWATLIRLAGCLGIASGINESGCGDLIAGAFTSLFGSDIQPVVFLAASVLVVMIVSNFISNTTAVFIVLPPVLAVCQQYGFNCIAFSIAVCYGANLSFATPLANAQTGTTMVAGYRFKDYCKYNLLLEFFVWLTVVVFIPLFWNLRV